MLTLVKEGKRETKNTEQSNSQNYSNVVSFESKAKTNEKSQENVLTAAKKLKW